MAITLETINLVSVDDLRLDPQNPRLPEDKLGLDQSALLMWLDDEETLDELAASMLANGFFAHEPLVVMSGDGQAPFTVVEGNRRFATLSILLQLPAAAEAGLEFDFERPPTSDQLEQLRQIPCLIISDADEVRKFLGFRHIGGLKTWSPEAKARYLEAEIDFEYSTGSRSPFREVGRRVGSNALGVRGPYIALKILKAARADLGIESASYVLKYRFGVWTRLLNSQEVRNFIGFGDATEYEDINASLGHLKKAPLERVLGDMKPQPGSVRAVLQDSRDATKYGRVIAHELARATLFAHGDLELAHQIVDRVRLASRLDNYTKSIDLLVKNIDSYELDVEVLSKAQALSASTRSLQVVIKDRLDNE